MKYCYICYSQTDPEFICDRCDEHYCEDCSYTFSLHYQFQGSRCYRCADQDRREKLDMRDVRINQIFMKDHLEEIKNKVGRVKRIRKDNRQNIRVGTFRVNANCNEDMIEELKNMQGFDVVRELESKLIEEMQSSNKNYINRIFNI